MMDQPDMNGPRVHELGLGINHTVVYSPPSAIAVRILWLYYHCYFN